MYTSSNDLLTVRSGYQFLKKGTKSGYVHLSDLADLLHPRVRIHRKSNLETLK